MDTPDTTGRLPTIVDRNVWQAELDRLLTREKAHTREGDAIAAARRRLPMTEVDARTPLIGADGEVPLLDVFEGRTQLVSYLHMWHDGKPAEQQCEGCTFFTGHALELSYLHSRDVTYATICQGPYAESARYRDFMDWKMPWYSAGDSSETLLAGRQFGAYVCYLRDGDRVFETYWTTGRGTEAGANQLPPAGPHRLRQAGDLGRLPRELAPAVRARRRGVPDRRSADSAVVPAEGRTLRRPRRVTRYRQANTGCSSPSTGS